MVPPSHSLGDKPPISSGNEEEFLTSKKSSWRPPQRRQKESEKQPKSEIFSSHFARNKLLGIPPLEIRENKANEICLGEGFKLILAGPVCWSSFSRVPIILNYTPGRPISSLTLNYPSSKESLTYAKRKMTWKKLVPKSNKKKDTFVSNF